MFQPGMAGIGLLILIAFVIVVRSLHRIGPTEVGLVTKKYARGKLGDDSPIAFNGEAGYQAEIVPTSILTLNWADAVSQAHNLDRNLSQIIAKSREGFVFKIDLQVQIHVPDTQAPKVISIVGTMSNLDGRGAAPCRPVVVL